MAPGVQQNGPCMQTDRAIREDSAGVRARTAIMAPGVRRSGPGMQTDRKQAVKIPHVPCSREDSAREDRKTAQQKNDGWLIIGRRHKGKR